MFRGGCKVGFRFVNILKNSILSSVPGNDLFGAFPCQLHYISFDGLQSHGSTLNFLPRLGPRIIWLPPPPHQKKKKKNHAYTKTFYL